MLKTRSSKLYPLLESLSHYICVLQFCPYYYIFSTKTFIPASQVEYQVLILRCWDLCLCLPSSFLFHVCLFWWSVNDVFSSLGLLLERKKEPFKRISQWFSLSSVSKMEKNCFVIMFSLTPCPAQKSCYLHKGVLSAKYNLTITYSHVTPILLINRISSQYSQQLHELHFFSALVVSTDLVLSLNETSRWTTALPSWLKNSQSSGSVHLPASLVRLV